MMMMFVDILVKSRYLGDTRGEVARFFFFILGSVLCGEATTDILLS